MKRIHDRISNVLSQITALDSNPPAREDFISLSKRLIHELLEDLLVFLRNKNVKTIFDELPQIGQLLGRLIVSTSVRGCPALYSLTTQCIRKLWKESPHGSLECAATQWASTQLKNSVTPPASLYFDVCQLGIPVNKVTEAAILQRKTQIEHELKTRYKERLNLQLRDQLSPLHLDKWFISTVTQLQRLPINSPLLSLWEQVIMVCSLYPFDDQFAKDTCIKLQTSLQQLKDLRPDVPPAACQKLWTYSKCALEQEILYRVELCTYHILPCFIRKVWRDSSLIPVCLTDITIYGVVCQILINVLENNLDIMTSFITTVMEEMRLTNHQESINLCNLYQSCFKQLVDLLSVHPNDIKMQNLGVHVKTVSEMFKDIMTVQNETIQLKKLCLQFRNWYLTSIHLCLICDKQYTSGCLDLISCYSSVLYNQQYQSLKDVLTRIVLCLRPLLVKSTLCFSDLMCVLSSNQNTSQGQIEVTVKHLLLTFIFQASGGLNILIDVLKFVSDSDNESDHITVLLDSHDQLQIQCNDWPLDKCRHFHNIVSCLLDECDEELHSDVKEAVNTLLETLNSRK